MCVRVCACVCVCLDHEYLCTQALFLRALAVDGLDLATLNNLAVLHEDCLLVCVCVCVCVRVHVQSHLLVRVCVRERVRVREPWAWPATHVVARSLSCTRAHREYAREEERESARKKRETGG